MFERLDMSAVDEECALFPFSAKTKALDYAINMDHIQPEDFDFLEIVSPSFSIMFIDEGDDGGEISERLLTFRF
jgi:hypothetical protein